MNNINIKIFKKIYNSILNHFINESYINDKIFRNYLMYYKLEYYIDMFDELNIFTIFNNMYNYNNVVISIKNILSDI